MKTQSPNNPGALVDRVLAAAPRMSVLVVGDFFLDEYFWIDPALTELSVETGLEAYQVVRKQRQPGAAGTVVSNLAALGVGRIAALGVVGEDGEGVELRRALERMGVDTIPLLTSNLIMTPTYCKPMIQSVEAPVRELNRFDTKNRGGVPSDLEGDLVTGIETLMTRFDAVIVADQVQERNCGVVTDRIRDALARIGSENPGGVVLADSRVRVGEFQNVLLKPNERELSGLFSVDPPAGVAHWTPEEIPLSELAAMGQELARRSGRSVFATCGARGMLVCGVLGVTHVPGAAVEGPIDIVGAGDSATAGIVMTLLAGGAADDAATVGNLVASVTVQKIGTTGTASPEELRSRARETVIEPQPIDPIWLPRPTVGESIEIVRGQPASPVHSAIFDFDGTVSLIREGWQDVMVPFMVEELLALGTGESEQELRVSVREFVYRLTGKQTVYQMMQLADEVRRRGGAPRDPQEYKEEYHGRLWERIQHRVVGLQNGSIERGRLLVPGVDDLLLRLQERGVRMYLASGTDLQFVRTEAEALGVTRFFGTNIYGALPELRSFSKKMIIEQIIREHGLEGPELVAFGDGYVEIENAREAGGRAVGAATDEARPGQQDGWKRNRLIAAGADVIVADFRESAELVDWLAG